MSQIEKHIDSITAVLVLANGTVPRVAVDTDYALSTMSAIFPKSLAGNIGFMFTNVLSPLHWNFSGDTLPDIPKDAPQFLLNNPVPLQKEHLKFKNSASKKKVKADLRTAVKAAERNALEMLVDLFDWLDSLEPQKMAESVTLYDRYQAIDATTTNILAQMDQVATRKAEINEQTRESERASAVRFTLCFHLALESYTHWAKDMDAFSHFEKTVDVPVWKQQPTDKLRYLCDIPDCYSNCQPSRLFAPISRLLRLRCAKCDHPHHSHSHTRQTWVQVSDTRLLVDEGMKKRWEAAKDEKENRKALIAAHEKALGDLDRIMDEAMEVLARLLEDYDGKSLSGSFAAHMEKARGLLEQHYMDTEEQGVNREQLGNMRSSSEQMKRKLDLLKMAKEKVQNQWRQVDVSPPI